MVPPARATSFELTRLTTHVGGAANTSLLMRLVRELPIYRPRNRRDHDRRHRDRRLRNRRVSSLQKLGWLSRAPSHRSLFSIVASCDRWGGKTRSSSSRLLLLAAHPGALVRGQRPKKLH